MTSTRSTPPQLGGAILVLVTIALSLATFMQTLDSTISNVAIPAISGALGSSNDQGTWVITSFGVANAIAIPLTGRLAQRIGELRLFILSVALFSLASLMCGLSTQLDMLIGFRIIQGLVAGPLVPLSQSLLLRNYPPEKRTMALSMWSMTVILAPICGPILGGYICDNYSWGWIFLINVPMGIISVVLCATLLKGRETATEPVKLNSVALALLVLGVGGLQLMLDKGKDLAWFNSTTIILLAVISAVSLVSLIIWESTSDNPILDLSLFKSRNFTVGSICITCGFLFYSGAIVLMPQLLQEVMNYTAIQAGLAYAPIGIMPLLISPVIGRFGHKVDMRLLVTFSFVVYALCYYWRAITFTTNIDFSGVIMPQLLQGCAVACFFLPLTSISLSGLPADKFANASSLSNFFRTLSGSVGTSLTMTLWSRLGIEQHNHLSSMATPFNPVFKSFTQEFQALGASASQGLDYVNQLITQQSMLLAANDIFFMAAWAFVGLTFIIWFARPPFTEQ